MQSSIIFDPSVDERALDREVNKIDSSLQEAGDIKPRIDESKLDSVELDGVVNGVGGGGGGGVGSAAGMGSLASRIPKPIAGVSVGSAMPVALGGAIGAGMLSAMHASSARLQTSTNLMGQAWTTFWRPLGDRLDELFIRDIAIDLLDETRNFEDTLRNGEWLKGFSELSLGIDFSEDTLAQKIGGSLGMLFGGPLMARMWSGLAQDMSDAVVNQIENTEWLKTGMENFTAGLDTLGDTLSNATPDVPDWRNMTPGVPDWRDITPGIPSWTGLSAKKFIQWALNGGSDADAGSTDGTPPSTGTGGTPPSTGGGGWGGGSAGPGGGINPGTPGGPSTGFQRGGVVHGPTTARVAESEPEVVQPLSEFENIVERIARTASDSGGGATVDMRAVERKLDDVNRNLKRLSQSLSDIGISVDGEQFGRLATDTRTNRLNDTDPTV